jgi:hypothetical protein
MFFVDTIFLSWREARGDNRLLIGILKRTADNGFSFHYNTTDYLKAKKEGFLNYPEFAEFGKTYTAYLREVFSFRLMPITRPERQSFLDFWGVPNNTDWFDELAFTQGKLTSDTFEFLAVFQPGTVNGFVTDIAGITHHDCSLDDLNPGDMLTYQLEPMSEAFNGKAVALYNHKNKKVGYIKQVHNNFFLAASNKVRTLRVKHVVKNGVLKECFLEVRL